uniref:Si:dkey-238o13.4 n=1 Tax=Hucho hucho TaxID=62062 RepID=A0A4W5MDP9_9TELE
MICLKVPGGTKCSQTQTVSLIKTVHLFSPVDLSSMSNADRVVLALGGAGTVGSGIVKALLNKGFKVAVISRDNSRLDKLRGFVSPSTRDNLTTLVGNVGNTSCQKQFYIDTSESIVEGIPYPQKVVYGNTSQTLLLVFLGSEEGAEVVKQALLKSVGKVTDIVSSLGFSWWQGGPPHNQTLKELHWVIETLLFSTFVSWKVFFPLVRDDPNCTYTFITGGAGEKLLMPGTGFLTVGAASTLAFCQVLREEYPEVPCKLNQVKINTGVAPPERMAPGYLNHLDLGESVATLVERKNTSHTVFPVNCPADLKTVILEGNLQRCPSLP